MPSRSNAAASVCRTPRARDVANAPVMALLDSTSAAARFGATVSLAACLALGIAGCGSGAETPTNQVSAGKTTSIASASGHTTASVSVDGAIVEGRNTFVVTFDPADATLTQASAFMPAMGHGAPTAPTIQMDGTTYRVSNFIFAMPGLWQVTLDVGVNGADDKVEFSVDVP